MSTWEEFGAQLPKKWTKSSMVQMKRARVQKYILKMIQQGWHKIHVDLDDLTKEDRDGLRKIGFRVKKGLDLDRDVCWVLYRKSDK